MDKKFIKTTDEKTAATLTAAGFKLVAHIGRIYTFLNENPAGFNFSEIDKKCIVYDNKLTL